MSESVGISAATPSSAADPRPGLQRPGRGLGARLALLATVALLVTMAGTGTVLVRTMEQTYRDEARSRAASLLGTLAVPCAMSMASGETERLRGYLSEIARVGGTHTGLLEIAMLDSAGRVVAQSPSATRGAAGGVGDLGLLDAGFIGRAWHAAGTVWAEVRVRRIPVLAVSVPAVAGSRQGTLVAAFDLRPLQHRMAWARLILVSFGLGVTAILALSLYFGLSRMVVRPIRGLALAASAIQHGQFATRAAVPRDADLGRLARAFNQMAREMQSHTERLERRVTERSAEVQAKNRELEQVNDRLRAAVAELARLARMDVLTDVHNRRHFIEVIQHELASRTQRSTALLMIDVDHFKLYNDRLGHQAGDAILREIAKILSEALRGTDVLSRYGGEEFTAVLPGSSREIGAEVAERLRSTIERHDFGAALGLDAGRVTVSIGVASHPSDAPDCEGLIGRADQALYVAKSAGRNQVVVWTPEMADRPAAHPLTADEASLQAPEAVGSRG